MKITKSYTLSKEVIDKINEEVKKLKLSSNSYLVNKILEDYFEK